MRCKILALLSLAASALMFSGCDGGKAQMAPEQTNVLGLYKNVQESYEPILQKIASSVEGSKGKLLITGHTDDTPIATAKYPSNWNLSLARATAVSNFLSQNSHLEGRLWPEGKGDSEPIMGNDSAQNRAINRRIEIDLLH